MSSAIVSQDTRDSSTGYVTNLNTFRRIDRYSEARGMAWLLLITLCFWCDDDGRCWPITETIAKRMRVMRDTVFANVKRLEKSGDIIVKRTARGANRYLITCGYTGDELAAVMLKPDNEGRIWWTAAEAKAICNARQQVPSSEFTSSESTTRLVANSLLATSSESTTPTKPLNEAIKTKPLTANTTNSLATTSPDGAAASSSIPANAFSYKATASRSDDLAETIVRQMDYHDLPPLPAGSAKTMAALVKNNWLPSVPADVQTDAIIEACQQFTLEVPYKTLDLYGSAQYPSYFSQTLKKACKRAILASVPGTPVHEAVTA